MRMKHKFLETLNTVGVSIDTTHLIVSYCILSCYSTPLQFSFNVEFMSQI